MEQAKKLPWWRNDAYDKDFPVVEDFESLAGPEGVALVKTWPDGRTDKGWGLQPPPGSTEGFMPRYNRGEFNARRVIYGFSRGKWAFAFVMRSVRLVCIDIDGKNGGLEQALKLGALPPTLAETSKGGNGYHLFYEVDEEWDLATGFGLFGDRIGIEQGVDFRATGCVYHHSQQRWNDRPAVKLPKHLHSLLTNRQQKITATAERIQKILADPDEMETLMMHVELIEELNKQIPVGKRNNTLFAIGSQMQEAQVPKWDELLSDRAGKLGLDDEEIAKLCANISRYAGVTAP